MIERIHIDIETKNKHGRDLRKVGLYKYAEDVIIDLFSYAFNDDKPVDVDIANGEIIPPKVIRALLDPSIEKHAFNAVFEIVCIESYLGISLVWRQWRCTMVRAMMCGLPGDLENCAFVLDVENQKDKDGKGLIRYFSMPCKATKTNGGRTWNLPSDAPEKWIKYRRYNRIDVAAERDVYKKLAFFPIQNEERNYWILDCHIAGRGVNIDTVLVNRAIEMDRIFRERLLNEAMKITGLPNANSVAQLKQWLSIEMDEDIEEEITTLKKSILPELLAKATSPKAKRIINIRQDLAKTSVKKYHTMVLAMRSDNRIGGLIQYYGASRTGRAAGRLVQVHNLPRGNFKNEIDLMLARKLTKGGKLAILELFFGAIPDVLSSLIRTAFIPQKGYTMLVADFRQIEARVLAWLAGETWRMRLFREGKQDIYTVSSARVFSLDITDVNDELRQRGKVFELACGFGGGKFAVLAMDTKKVLKEDEVQPLVDAWREANPKIVKYWKDIETAAKHSIQYGSRTSVRNVTFEYKKGFLFITLPSGRILSYANATLKPGKSWGTRIVYWGMHQTKRKWWEMETYGGKLVENIVQAVARDCLYFGLMNAYKAGYDIVMHVHDEVVAETKTGNISELKQIFNIVPDWAEGLPLDSSGFESKFYKK